MEHLKVTETSCWRRQRQSHLDGLAMMICRPTIQSLHLKMQMRQKGQSHDFRHQTDVSCRPLFTLEKNKLSTFFAIYKWTRNMEMPFAFSIWIVFLKSIIRLAKKQFEVWKMKLNALFILTMKSHEFVMQFCSISNWIDFKWIF